MKKQYGFFVAIPVILLMSCNGKVYPTNGETIYRTGRNWQGEKMVNRKASLIPFVRS